MLRPTPALLALVPLAVLAGCSSGPFEIAAELRREERVLRVTFETHGANTFGILGQSCEAPRRGSCTLDVPTAELPGGWSNLPVTTRRRTDRKDPKLRLHFGDEVFPRDCTTEPLPPLGPGESDRLSVRCQPVDGFRFALADRPMDGHRGEIALADVLRLNGPTPTPGAPVVPRFLPLTVLNRGQGSWPRPIPIAVAPPLTQLQVDGWADPWFEPTMPVRIRVEAGAKLFLDGAPLPVPDGGGWVERALDVPSAPPRSAGSADGEGRVRFVFRAEVEGKAPAEFEVAVTGRFPATPLYIDSPRVGRIITTDESFQITGRTDPRAVLFLGRRPVSVDADGRFSVDAPLEEGQNDVEILAELDATAERAARARTVHTFSVRRNPLPSTTAKKTGALPDPGPYAPVAADPARHVGQRVELRLRIESLATTLTDDGCRTTIEGLGCLADGRARAEVGFRPVEGWTCLGGEHAAVVEISRCPDLVEGQWVDVLGEVTGVLGGRRGQLTVSRPMIEADRVLPHATVGGG